MNKSPKAIRLIILQPSRYSDEVIRCRLVLASLDDLEDFEALSYAWGDPGGERNIIVNDLVKPVRRNLWDALSHLRRTDRPRTLWIDAICP